MRVRCPMLQTGVEGRFKARKSSIERGLAPGGDEMALVQGRREKPLNPGVGAK